MNLQQVEFPHQNKMAQPLVSVIIPVYNRLNFLKEAVESVLRQTYKNYELIIVDDGSTDDTPLIKEIFPPIKYIRHPENKGVAAARNTGIKNSHGELLAFLDSDDLWLPEKLEKQVEFMNQNPDLLISQTEEIWIRNGKRVNPRKKHKKEGGNIFFRSLELCLISPSAVILKRELLKEVGLFDEDLKAAEDYDLWLRITWKYPVGLLPQPLVIKRGGHPDQLSRTTPVIDRYRIIALKKLLLSVPLSNAQRSAVLKELQRKCWIVYNGALKKNNSEIIDFCQNIAGETGIKLKGG